MMTSGTVEVHCPHTYPFRPSVYFLSIYENKSVSSSCPGGHLGDGAAASGNHDEDGELPEAYRTEEGPDRRRRPHEPRKGATL